MADQPRSRRVAVRPIRWIGKGIGRSAKGVWRAVRGRRIERGPPMASITAQLIDSRVHTVSEDQSECNEELIFPFQLPNFSQLQLPDWLNAMLPVPEAASSSSSSRDNPLIGSSSSTGTSSGFLQRPSSLQHAATAAAAATRTAALNSSSSSSSSTQILAQMLNTSNTFPMVLTPAATATTNSSNSGMQQQEVAAYSSDAAAAASAPSSSSSSSQRQLLTVGHRNWGNWWDGRGLLKVKIYDFAVYVDGQQAQSYLPAALGSSSSNASLLDTANPLQQQHSSYTSSSSSLQEQQQDLPSLIKSHSSGIGLSLILRAAREVPLHLLSEEYERVLARRLARAGGDSSDSAALKQLLDGFSHPERLPAAVRGSSSSSSVAPAAAGTGEAAGGGASVVKGAMIVFERSADGTVTARVGPHVLSTVHSPKLGEALFDLYLGDQPVSKTAKDAAAKTLSRMSLGSSSAPAVGLLPAAEQDAEIIKDQDATAQQPFYLPQGKSEEIKCEGSEVRGFGRKGRRGDSRSAGGLGLGVSDLAACVLHTGN